MKKIIIPLIGFILISVTIVLLIIFNKTDFELLGNKEEIKYTIEDEKPDLLDGVYGLISKKSRVDVALDDTKVNWNKAGQYTANYIYNEEVVGNIKIIVMNRRPYIINHIDLVYYIDSDSAMNYFATDIRAYDIHDEDITYGENNELRITVDDSSVDYFKLGTYTATYNIVDDYSNEHKEPINVIVRKNDKKPVIYGINIPLYIAMGEDYSREDLLKNIIAYDHMALDITNRINIDDSIINVNKEGSYLLEYTVKDNEIETKVSRTVVVIKESKPLIIGVKEYKIINVGDLTVDLLSGVKAYDYIDKELTNELNISFRFKDSDKLLDISELFENYINEVGDYIIVYKIVNSSGDSSYKEMLLKIIMDVDKPIIEGVKDIIYPANESLPNLLDGVIAYKKYDDDIIDDLTSNIEVSLFDKVNNVILEVKDIDYTILKTYIILYSVKDRNGATTEIQRNLYIIDIEEPVYYNVPYSFEYIITSEGFPDNQLPNYLEGVVAWDLVDGELTSKIKIDETGIDYKVAGQYYIKYLVSDSNKNTAELEVIVYVVNE